MAPTMILIAMLLALEPAFAWENDVHFGLTKWLAFSAGYSMSDANLIAQGTLDPDLGINDARWLVALYACIKKDSKASMHVRDLHFPSFAPIPSPPTDRRVTEGSPAAERSVWKEVRYDRPMRKEELDYALRKLGEALHPLQDSWSHAGVPSVPSYDLRLFRLTTCDNGLAWGHPGEWDSHNADLTHLHVDAAEAAASKTYELLETYMQSHKDQLGHHSPTPWDTLRSQVSKFAAARTKQAKREWFNRNGFGKDDLNFLDDITLEESESKQKLARRTVADSLSSISLAEHKSSTTGTGEKERSTISAPLDDILQTFFKRWLVNKDFESLKDLVEPKVLESTYKDPQKGDQVSDSLKARLRFKPWLFDDHGLANRVNHGRGITEEQERLILDNEATTHYGSWRDAFIPICADDSLHPYLVFPLYNESHTLVGYAALARIKHAPHDVIVLEVDRNFRITSFSWEIDH